MKLKCSSIIVVACMALIASVSHGALITNGDLNTAVVKHGGIYGNSVYSLNEGAGTITETGTGAWDPTGAFVNEWVMGGVSRGFTYDAAGGNGGGGAFVRNGDNQNEQARAVQFFARDDKATTGDVTISLDTFLVNDNLAGAGAIDLYLRVELYAWNAGQAGVGMSMAASNGDKETYFVTDLGDATTLLSTEIAIGAGKDVAVTGGGWETASLGTVSLGTGYDFYAWRVGAVGADAADTFSFDNLTIDGGGGPPDPPVPLAPDDGSISADLVLWLRSPEIDYNASTGNWTDRSGKGNSLDVASGFVAPDTVLFSQSASIFSNSFSALSLGSGALLKSPHLNASAGVSELTVLVVYKTLSYSSQNRPVGFGSYLAGDGSDNFNLAADPSIRKDNGSVTGYAGSSDLTPPGYFIRSSRMSVADGVDEWFFVDAANGVEQVLNTSSAYTTHDEFYVGDIRDSTDANVAEIIVYSSSLSASQITGINEWLQENVGIPDDPVPPAGVVASTAGSGEIHLSWAANNHPEFSHFSVKRSDVSGGPYTEVATPSVSDYTDSGLTIGTTYYYIITAVQNDASETTPSAEVSATPVDAAIPSALVARARNEKVILTWQAINNPDFSHFSVRRSLVAGGPYSEISTPTELTYTDTGLTNGVPYFYVVVSVQNDSSQKGPTAEVGATPYNRPNFIFILTDDQDTYSLNAYRRSEPCETDIAGTPYLIDTPNIDRLADEGMVFHQARLMGSTSGAVCTPSRHTIMTGRNTWHMTVDNVADTLPGTFNRAGYNTFRTCKLGNSYNFANYEFKNGLDNSATQRDAADGEGSDWHADQVVEFLENRQLSGDSDPFLIYFGFSHPHDPRHGRPDLLAKYGALDISDPADISLNTNAPPLPANWFGCTPATYPAHPFDFGGSTIRDEVSVDGVFQYRTEAVIRNEIGKNFACVDWIDQQIGRVLDTVEDPNGDGDTSDSELDNTYIIFTSDHGIAIGRHGLQGKQNLYEHTWRVPYIVRGPGIAPGSETDALVYLHDTFPTLCDLAGISPPTTIGANDGESFKPVLHGTSETARSVLYGLYSAGSKPGIRAVTDGRWKLVKYDVLSDATQHTQLFDLQANPFELLPEHGVPNLADLPAYSLIRQHMEELLMQQREVNVDPYAYLGDRILYRFEEGAAGQTASTITDFLHWENDGTAMSGNSSVLPVYSSSVYAPTDALLGEPNTVSLDFEQDSQHYIRTEYSREFSFGAAPFTIEAWVALETLPAGADQASCMPVAMKKVIPSADTQLDYLFLAAAGNFGSGTTFANLALITASEQLVSSLSIPDTGWHRISVAFDPVQDIVRFTMDDQVDIHSGITGNGLANTGPLVLGAYFDGSGNLDSAFDGLMDEVSITGGYLPVEQLQPLLSIPEPVPSYLHAPIITDDGITLQFDSNPLHLYDLESKATLNDPEWALEQSFLWSGGATTSLELEIPTAQTSKFYRVRTREPLRP